MLTASCFLADRVKETFVTKGMTAASFCAGNKEMHIFRGCESRADVVIYQPHFSLLLLCLRQPFTPSVISKDRPVPPFVQKVGQSEKTSQRGRYRKPPVEAHRLMSPRSLLKFELAAKLMHELNILFCDPLGFNNTELFIF